MFSIKKLFLKKYGDLDTEKSKKFGDWARMNLHLYGFDSEL